MSHRTELRIGIDIGGTKIQAVVLDHQGAIVSSRRTATPRAYRGTVAAVRDLVHALESEARGEARVGVGSPGSISPVTGQLRNSNASWLLGQDLKGDLSRELGRSILLENDANCFVRSEARTSSLERANVVWGVVLGSGVGSGLVVDGEILRGRNLLGGEFGHCSLPWPTAEEHPGRPCYCGRRGCIETFLSGGALVREFRERGGEATDAAQVVRRASAGSEEALACLSRFYHRLARSLAMVVNVLDPDVIVLGGGLANIQGIFDEVPEILRRWIFSDCFDTPLFPSTHGDLSSARGAALLWPAG